MVDCNTNCIVDDPGGLDCNDLLVGYEACADWAVLQAGNSQYTQPQLVQHWYDIFLLGGYVTVGQPPVTAPLTLASLQTLFEDCCGGPSIPTSNTPHSCEFLNFTGGGYMYDQAAGTLSVTYNLSHNNTGLYSTQYAWQPGDTVYWQVMSSPGGIPGDMGSGFANQAPNPSPQSPDGTGTITVTGLPTTPGVGFEFRLAHYGNTNNPNTMSCVIPLNL